MPPKAREVIKLLKKDGWFECGQVGSHLHLKHPSKTGKVTIPVHKGKDLEPTTFKSILKQAGLE